jgi:hypothetical protein
MSTSAGRTVSQRRVLVAPRLESTPWMFEPVAGRLFHPKRHTWMNT